MAHGRQRLLAVVVGLALAVAGCSGGSDDAGGGRRSGGGEAPTEVRRGDPVTLRVLAGSELADLVPILADAAEATGVTVELTETGTREGVVQITTGRTPALRGARRRTAAG